MDIKTTLKSLMMLGIIAALLGGATYAVFSDTETSIGNQMVAGTIDFEVDNENPWTDTTWSGNLDDMKPCVVKYGEFEIYNVGVNPMNLWKKLTITGMNGGEAYYAGYASSEPEYVENGGEFNANGLPNGLGYDERDNIASYTLYDMTVVNDGVTEVLIDAANQVRLDNVNGVWIYLGELAPGKIMVVNQSYHLSSWIGASEPTVTNWAQGDVLTFDVELYGEQITGPGMNTNTGTVVLTPKDPVTWAPIYGGASGILTFEKTGEAFNFDLDVVGLKPQLAYTLIYYADPYPGDNPGADIITAVAQNDGTLNLNGQSIDLNMDLPTAPDTNAPAGAKIWLVPAADYDTVNDTLIAWNANDYLYEMNLITYDDTDV